MNIRRSKLCACWLGGILSLGVAIAWGEPSGAVPTRAAYRQAVAAHMIQDWPDGRWKNMVSRLLESPDPPPDGKFVGAGRGEVGLVLPLALTGAYLAEKNDAEKARQFIDDAIKTLRACCRVAVDHYYADNEDAEGGNRGQISFVLAEVVQACQILRIQGTCTARSGTACGKCWRSSRIIA